MSKNALKAFILGRKGIVQRLVDDVQQDETFPDAKSWPELCQYLKKRNPHIDSEILRDAEHLWNLYAKTLGEKQ